MAQALEAARKIEFPSARSWALVALAPHLADPLRSEVLAQALEAARANVSEWRSSPALGALAPQLPEPLRSDVLTEVLETARAAEDEEYCSRVLTALAPHLPDPMLTQALEAARVIDKEGYRSLALEALALPLRTRPASNLFPIWEQTLPILASRTRRDLLADLRSLLPVVLRLGGQQAVAEIFRSIQDVGRWWP